MDDSLLDSGADAGADAPNPDAVAGADAGGTPPADSGEGNGVSDASGSSDSLLETEKSTYEEIDFSGEGKPEKLDDKYWDAENGKLNENAVLKDLHDEKARADGLRRAKGKEGNQVAGEPPKDVEGYTFTAPEGFEVSNDDALLKPIKEKALEAGVPADAFNSVMSVVMGELAEFVADGGAGKTQEQLQADAQANRQAELAKLGENGQGVIDAVGDWIGGLQNQGILTEEDVASLKGSATSAGVIKALNQLRIRSGGDPNVAVTTGGDVEISIANAERIVNSEEFQKGDKEAQRKFADIVEALRKKGIVYGTNTDL